MGAKTATHQPDSAAPPVGDPPAHPHRSKTIGKAERARLQAMSPQERFNGKDGRPGYTVMPHPYWTVLPRKCWGGSGAQHFAVGYIIDRTFGAPGNPEWVKINCVNLARLTGLNARTFTQVLEDAASVGIVKRRRPGCRDCEEGACDCPGREWEYKTYPEEWVSLPDREKSQAAPVPDGDEDEKDDKPEALPEMKEPHVDRLVQPGATAKRVEVVLKDMPRPVYMQTANNSPWPLLFRHTVDADGIIWQYVMADPAWRRKGEVSGVATPLGKASVENADVTNAQRIAEYRTYFEPVFVRELKKPLDKPFLRKIAEASQYAPTADFDPALASLRKRKLLTSGMILTVATDQIGPAWAARRGEVEAQLATRVAEAAESASFAPLHRTISERCGTTLDDFKRITRNPKAEVEDWLAAQDAVKREFQSEASHG